PWPECSDPKAASPQHQRGPCPSDPCSSAATAGAGRFPGDTWTPPKSEPARGLDREQWAPLENPTGRVQSSQPGLLTGAPASPEATPYMPGSRQARQRVCRALPTEIERRHSLVWPSWATASLIPGSTSNRH